MTWHRGMKDVCAKLASVCASSRLPGWGLRDSSKRYRIWPRIAVINGERVAISFFLLFPMIVNDYCLNLLSMTVFLPDEVLYPENYASERARLGIVEGFNTPNFKGETPSGTREFMITLVQAPRMREVRILSHIILSLLIRFLFSFCSMLCRYSQAAKIIESRRTKYTDFELIKVIGQGGFGRVELARHKRTRRVYAIKLMSKQHLLDHSQSGYWEERDVMVKASSEWLCTHRFFFQGF
ncbi:unnamed protein product [Trichobilharzia regenti]|nr:unnamed protein product [Trichobilharzia regenti]